MGGKSDDSGSREMINMQKEEAARARALETDRSGRIRQGLDRIRNAFEGNPVMGSIGNRFNVGNIAGATQGAGVAGLPAGYSYVQGPATPAAAAPRRSTGQVTSGRDQAGFYQAGLGAGGREGNQYNWNQPRQAVAASTPGAWMIQGPDGRLYRQGENIDYSTQYDTGQRTGQWQEGFLNKFKQGLLDYYNPQVQEQYAKGKDETTFRHARAGTLRSTSAAESAADLAKQNAIREGEVLSKADQAAGDLRNRIASERQKAEAQLYATENPDVAANQALSAITNISAEAPTLTPLGQIFDIATVGGANLLTGAQNARLRKQYLPGQGGAGATSIVTR